MNYKIILVFYLVSFSTLAEVLSIPHSNPWSKFFESCPTTKDCQNWNYEFDSTDRVIREPDYKLILLEDSPNLKLARKEIEPILYGLMGDSPCHEYNTLYIAKVLAHFWPGTPEYDALNKNVRHLLNAFFELANTGTYRPEGREDRHYSAPQAKCIAEKIREDSLVKSEFLKHCPVPDTCPKKDNAFWNPDLEIGVRDEPDYAGIKIDRGKLSPETSKTFALMNTIVWRNDPCDNMGALYLGKVLAYFWPGTSEYQNLNKNSQRLINILFQSGSVADQAKCFAQRIGISRAQSIWPWLVSIIPKFQSSCDEVYDDLDAAVFGLARKRADLFTYLATTEELAASEDRFFNCLQEMIHNKADVNYADSTGATPASLAAYFRFYRIVTLLEANGADMDLKDKSGYSARKILESRKENYEF